jgi:hypothetical protein
MDITEVKNRDGFTSCLKNRDHVVAQGETVLLHQASPGSKTESESARYAKA